MGYGPDKDWQQLIVSVWCIFIGLAMVNSGRKSSLSGSACAGVLLLTTLVLLIGVVGSRAAVLKLLFSRQA
ncbi:hypothetical protein C3432_19505 [Citrobacter amalonaticus]|uniref:Uncharacterized protein n=2 Tax=Citrobacter amalonaticus TaxID=35703 RepID=A0A2S4RXR3_CITAM|nr:hypothetical protein C3432_19505 [Citrobacter amalonaticus]POT74473.1 hypothetical protein C3436_17145 [Citrobacter amalonaticus]POU65272.1 hypothetical protein C3430_13885 [Citrobacter amalonaticus]POV04107.1 hypothetical protein C3424_18825 [Citrobacter amalonaticus]